MVQADEVRWLAFYYLSYIILDICYQLTPRFRVTCYEVRTCCNKYTMWQFVCKFLRQICMNYHIRWMSIVLSSRYTSIYEAFCSLPHMTTKYIHYSRVSSSFQHHVGKLSTFPFSCEIKLCHFMGFACSFSFTRHITLSFVLAICSCIQCTARAQSTYIYVYGKKFPNLKITLTVQ